MAAGNSQGAENPFIVNINIIIPVSVCLILFSLAGFIAQGFVILAYYQPVHQ